MRELVSSPAVRVIGVGRAARGAWQQVLATDRTALPTQTPEWLDCVCAAGRYEDVTRAYAAADGRRLVLPLVRRAAVESSLPWGWGTGGLLCSGGDLLAHDVTAVAEDLLCRRVLRIAVRPGPAREEAWRMGMPCDVVRTHQMVQSVDLSGGFEHVWRHRFNGGVRRACAKAERSSLDIECDDGGRLVDAFDALYRKSVERWARKAQRSIRVARWTAQLREPRRKYAIVASGLGRACRIWLASRGGEPAAAIIVLSHGEHSSYWRGAMDPAVEGGTRANDLLHRLAIEDACTSGRRFYHMGESAPGSSLARFKRGFGAEELHYTGYRFEALPLTAAERFARRAVSTTKNATRRRT
jgi:hypothetical protein